MNHTISSTRTNIARNFPPEIESQLSLSLVRGYSSPLIMFQNWTITVIGINAVKKVLLFNFDENLYIAFNDEKKKATQIEYICTMDLYDGNPGKFLHNLVDSRMVSDCYVAMISHKINPEQYFFQSLKYWANQNMAQEKIILESLITKALTVDPLTVVGSEMKADIFIDAINEVKNILLASDITSLSYYSPYLDPKFYRV